MVVAVVVAVVVLVVAVEAVVALKAGLERQTSQTVPVAEGSWEVDERNPGLREDPGGQS